MHETGLYVELNRQDDEHHTADTLAALKIVCEGIQTAQKIDIEINDPASEVMVEAKTSTRRNYYSS